jgi:hypothetical protein
LSFHLIDLIEQKEAAEKHPKRNIPPKAVLAVGMSRVETIIARQAIDAPAQAQPERIRLFSLIACLQFGQFGTVKGDKIALFWQRLVFCGKLFKCCGCGEAASKGATGVRVAGKEADGKISLIVSA